MGRLCQRLLPAVVAFTEFASGYLLCTLTEMCKITDTDAVAQSTHDPHPRRIRGRIVDDPQICDEFGNVRDLEQALLPDDLCRNSRSRQRGVDLAGIAGLAYEHRHLFPRCLLMFTLQLLG